MKLEEMLERAGLSDQMAEAASIVNRLPSAGPADWRHLAVVLSLRLVASSAPAGTVLGISGGQGAGKTTLANALIAALGACGRQAVSLSIDDFYLSRAARARLGARVHPLLATRGVPGTHDVARACAVLETLKGGGRCRRPLFDKAVDDRLPESSEPLVGPGLDVIVFEGWCLGAPAQPAERLRVPLNDLERLEDVDGRWRRFVNDALAGEYADLWSHIDQLLYLEVPDMEAVVRWRTEQEQQHPPDKRMSADQLARFVAHYERLTRWMLEVLPGRAELVGLLDREHRLRDLTIAT